MRVFLVTVTGAPIARDYPNQASAFVLAETAEAAADEVAPRYPSMRVTAVTDCGEPRSPALVEHRQSEPSPGIVFDRLVAEPWPTSPGLTVEATRSSVTGECAYTWPSRGNATHGEVLDLATSLDAVVREAVRRGWAR